MRGGRASSLASSPTMVGAITTLITIVAVFLAYNATAGLPFVPVYRISAEIPNAQRLLPNNEVRIAGRRVGLVEEITTVAGEDGAVAKVDLKLEKSVEPIAEDTIVRTRYSSAFGLKYLELVPGDGDGLPEGSVIPLAQARRAIEFDDIGNTFDRRTREAVRGALVGFGDALAARGPSLNTAIDRLDPLLRHALPVAIALSDDETRLRRLIAELGDAARIVAPVSEQNAALFAAMARTFAAISENSAELQEAISEGVPTLEQGTVALREVRPFLGEFAALGIELRPGARELRRGLPALNSALFRGAEVLPGVPELARLLDDSFLELDLLAEQPQTKTTLLRLRDTFASTQHAADHIVRAQTVCNYLNYWFTHFANAHSEPSNVGTMQRDLSVTPPGGFAPPNEKFSGDEPPMGPLADYAGVMANGRRSTASGTAQPGLFDPRVQPILHLPSYGQAFTDGVPNCSAGQLGYPLGEDLLPGQRRSNAALLTQLPGPVGPTFTGRWREP